MAFGALVACFALLPALQDDNPNGYVDYVRAGELLSASRYNQLVQFQTALLAYQRTGDPESRPAPLGSLTADSTNLQVMRAITKEAEPALRLMQLGATKRSYSPRQEATPETLFPELAKFKALAKASAMTAFVRAADGQSVSAAQLLLDTLRMAQGIDQELIIANLVGVAIEAIVCAEFERILPSLNRQAADLVERQAAGMIPSRPRIVERFQSEKVVMASYEPAYAEEYDAVIARAAKIFTLPESHWAGAPPAAGTGSESLDDLNTTLDSLITVVLKSRTILRLLQLHAAVYRYRWDNGMFPDSLEAAVGTERAMDPATGHPFVYKVDRGRFELYSEGPPAIGRIDLKYRRDPSLTVSTGDVSDAP